MPKAYTVGNGSTLVGFDEHARVRDFYFPYVGQENHVGDDLRHRIAVRVDGQTYFLSEDFHVSTECAADTLAGNAVATNHDIGIRIHFDDIVYNEKDILVRTLQIENNADRQREVTVYFCQEFQVSQTTQANTAYYDPRRDVIIHYRGNRAFLINTADSNGSFDDYTTGVFGIQGKEGSYHDARDGSLSGNSIEHGPCDSCISVTRTLKLNSDKTVRYWVAAGKSIRSVFKLDQYILEKGPDHIQKSTKDFWSAWLDRREFQFDKLPDPARNLFRRSLLTIRSHFSENGAIIASSDSDMLQKGKDTYSYVWPRDGAHIAAALDRVGDWNIAQRFFAFSDDVLSPDGYFMHKFNPDKSLGSSWHPWIYEGEPQLPIQEDETGVVLHELWNHYDRSRDLEFIENLYYPLIRKAADFMIGYRNEETGLPKASYDLWEEKIGIHTYTAASVYGGLKSAGKIARLLGKSGDARKFDTVAGDIKQAMLNKLVIDGIFVKGYQGAGSLDQPDHTADMSTVYGLYKYGVLSANHELLEATAEHVFAETNLDTDVGGYARYAGDDYYRNQSHTDIPGNPWFIATLWHARYCINTADTLSDLKEPREDFSWVIDHARPSGVLSEQVDPYSGEQKSAAPLIWSHAEFIKAVMVYENAVDEFNQDNQAS
jgi:GH15 family glucan-1,4-alpha-glucosidase